MASTQSVSSRQVSVASQQFPTMHWLHGVPPGSSVQVPASTGGLPHVVPLHMRPTQHSLGPVQLDPGGKQLPDPQMP